MENAIVAPDTSIPPIVPTRNQYGLLSGVNYLYKPDGKIDWRRMVKPDHLVIKKENFEKKGKPIPDSTEGLDDKDLLILLDGIRELADLRGYTSLRFNITAPLSTFIAVECVINWLPNYESTVLTSAGTADAHHGNVNQLGRNFLTAFAENRAFIRAVRNYLKVPILGKDELGLSEADDMRSSILQKTMDQFGIGFDVLKEKLVAEGVEGADKWSSPNDIPSKLQFSLIERIKKKAKEKGLTNTIE